MIKISMILALPLFLVMGCADQVNTQVTRYQFDDLRDTDGDGVINQRDVCSETPTNSPVDSQGCTKWYQGTDVNIVSFFFEMDKSDIKAEHDRPLNEVMGLLNQYPKSKVILIGDTSPEASLTYNKALAQRRTHAVRKLLTDRGVDGHRIEEQEFSQHTSLTNQLKERKRRTIAVVETQSKEVAAKWTIYSSDTSLAPNSKVELSNEN